MPAKCATAVYEDLFLPSHGCLTPLAEEFSRWQYGSIFIRLAAIASETREMSRNSIRIWPYSSSRSSKVIDLGVNGKPMCDFLLVINCNFSHICYRFRDIQAWIEKLLIFPSRPLFDLPLGGNPLEFLDETYPAKTRGMILPYAENFIILTSTVFLWYTHLTDGR